MGFLDCSWSRDTAEIIVGDNFAFVMNVLNVTYIKIEMDTNSTRQELLYRLWNHAAYVYGTLCCLCPLLWHLPIKRHGRGEGKYVSQVEGIQLQYDIIQTSSVLLLKCVCFLGDAYQLPTCLWFIYRGLFRAAHPLSSLYS